MRNVDLDDLLRIIFVVQAISQNVSKGLQSPLESIGDSFLLCLKISGCAPTSNLDEGQAHFVKTCCFAFQILSLATSHILVVASVAQSNTDYSRDAE